MCASRIGRRGLAVETDGLCACGEFGLFPERRRLLFARGRRCLLGCVKACCVGRSLEASPAAPSRRSGQRCRTSDFVFFIEASVGGVFAFLRQDTQRRRAVDRGALAFRHPCFCAWAAIRMNAEYKAYPLTTHSLPRCLFTGECAAC